MSVFEAIFTVIDDLCQNGIDEDELIMTVEQIKTDLVMASESAKSRMSGNVRAIMSRGYIIPMEEILEKLSQVTCEDVQNFARKYLKKESASVSLVGNLVDLDMDEMKKKINLK